MKIVHWKVILGQIKWENREKISECLVGIYHLAIVIIFIIIIIAVSSSRGYHNCENGFHIALHTCIHVIILEIKVISGECSVRLIYTFYNNNVVARLLYNSGVLVALASNRMIYDSLLVLRRYGDLFNKMLSDYHTYEWSLKILKYTLLSI